jgi:sugar/nucleoside kinase (ribokinase family)
MSHFDILSVGDVVTDAFINLFEDQAKIITEHDGSRWLAMPFATKLPFEYTEVVAGAGNASNAAVSFARLGLKTGFVTNVGSDPQGREIIATLDHHKVDPRFIRVNARKRSNYNYVLWYEEERTILINHEEYEYHWPRIIEKEAPRWVYFSSISKNALDYHDDIADWLDDNPMVHLAFQPGTFQIKTGAKRLKRLYERASILLLNREEAALVGGGDVNNMHDLFDKLHALGPQVIVITDGPKGAYASDGMRRLFMPPYPDPKPPFERTGAGDAFSSTFVAAAAKGMSLEEALRWAPINSMSVVQKVGSHAGLLTERELLEYVHKAPKDYQAKPF